MYCSPPGSSVHGISRAGILEWFAISSSRGSARHRDWTHVSCIAGRFFTTRKAHESLLLISNGAMKILFLLFCFMFVACFSIYHLNIWWAFLWLYLVTSDFAPLWGPLLLLEWVACPFSSGSFWCRNPTGVSYIAGQFFTRRATRHLPLVKENSIQLLKN